MNVFISWSGVRSQHVASCLRQWLPKVIQAIKPWMSNEDIISGARWSTEIASQLANSSFGIVCVTPENEGSSWLNFESGAISKTVGQSAICPYLHDIPLASLSGPLSQFQSVIADETGTRRLVASLNAALPQSKIPEGQLDEIFEVWWPMLAAQLSQCPTIESVKPAPRSMQDLLEEVVENTREQLRRENLRMNHLETTDEKLDTTLQSMMSQASNAQELFETLKSVTKERMELIDKLAPGLASLLSNSGMDEQVSKLIHGGRDISATFEELRILDKQLSSKIKATDDTP